MTDNYVPKLAQEVRRYVLGNNNNMSTPVDLSNQIEKRLHIDVLFTNDNKFKGCLKINPVTKLPEIIVNNNKSYYQQQHIIAYELGYLILEYQWIPNKKFNNSAQILYIYK